MAELNFTKGKRICKVIDSNIKSENGTEIYLYQSDYKCCLECNSKCNSKKKCCPQCAKVEYHNKEQVEPKNSNDMLDKLLKILINENYNKREIESIINEKYDDSVVGDGLKGANVKKDKIILRSGKFQIIPSNVYGQPDCIYFVGRAGSGKTFALAEYLREFRKYYPKYRVYLFSQKSEDKLLDKLIDKRIPLDQLEEANFEADNFKETMVIFDDVDVISDKKQEKATFDLINKILEVGRSYNIFSCLTMHLPCNGNQTKRLINRCTHFMYFKNSSNHGTDYALKEYFGISNDELKKLHKLNNRSVCIIRECPQLIISNDLICFQNSL
jgi:hypothetical protein